MFTAPFVDTDEQFGIKEKMATIAICFLTGDPPTKIDLEMIEELVSRGNFDQIICCLKSQLSRFASPSQRIQMLHLAIPQGLFSKGVFLNYQFADNQYMTTRNLIREMLIQQNWGSDSAITIFPLSHVYFSIPITPRVIRTMIQNNAPDLEKYLPNDQVAEYIRSENLYK